MCLPIFHGFLRILLSLWISIDGHMEFFGFRLLNLAEISAISGSLDTQWIPEPGGGGE